MISYRVEVVDLMTDDGYWNAERAVAAAIKHSSPFERLAHTVRYDQTHVLFIWEREK